MFVLLRAIVLFSSLALSLLIAVASGAWAQEQSASGKGTIGMVCTDFAGNEITWKQSGPENGFRFEQCVRDLVAPSIEAFRMTQELHGGIPLQSVVNGLSEFISTADSACRDKRVEPRFFY